QLLRRFGTLGLGFPPMEIKQRLSHSLCYKSTDLALPVKLHFALRGMDVDIDGRRIDLQEETTNRVTSFHQRGVIALQQSEVQPPVLHRPTIHKDMLILTRRAGDAGSADESPEPK